MLLWIFIMVQHNSNQKYNKREDGKIYQNVCDTTSQRKSCDIFSSYNFNKHLKNIEDGFCGGMFLIKCLVLSYQQLLLIDQTWSLLDMLKT